jgi:hypothetical protein
MWLVRIVGGMRVEGLTKCCREMHHHRAGLPPTMLTIKWISGSKWERGKKAYPALSVPMNSSNEETL